MVDEYKLSFLTETAAINNFIVKHENGFSTNVGNVSRVSTMLDNKNFSYGNIGVIDCVDVVSNQMNIANKEGNHKCDRCDETFDVRWRLFEHVTRAHENIENIKYECEYCYNTYRNIETMHKHIDIHHSDNGTTKCDLCSKTFNNRNLMVAHMQVHTDERNHKCNMCTKTFKSKKNLWAHVKCHSVHRTYKCKVCDKSYITNCDLIKHMRCHIDETNNKCNICSKALKTKNSLMNHMKNYHSNEKKYECNVCSQCFRTKANMLVHMKCHSYETNFKQKNELLKQIQVHNSKPANVVINHVNHTYDDEGTFEKRSMSKECNIKEENVDVVPDILENDISKMTSKSQLRLALTIIKEEEYVVSASSTDVDSAVEVKQETSTINVGDYFANRAADNRLESVVYNTLEKVDTHRDVKLEIDYIGDVN